MRSWIGISVSVAPRAAMLRWTLLRDRDYGADELVDVADAVARLGQHRRRTGEMMRMFQLATATETIAMRIPVASPHPRPLDRTRPSVSPCCAPATPRRAGPTPDGFAVTPARRRPAPDRRGVEP